MLSSCINEETSRLAWSVSRYRFEDIYAENCSDIVYEFIIILKSTHPRSSLSQIKKSQSLIMISGSTENPSGSTTCAGDPDLSTPSHCDLDTHHRVSESGSNLISDAEPCSMLSVNEVIDLVQARRTPHSLQSSNSTLLTEWDELLKIVRATGQALIESMECRTQKEPIDIRLSNLAALAKAGNITQQICSGSSLSQRVPAMCDFEFSQREQMILSIREAQASHLETVTEMHNRAEKLETILVAEMDQLLEAVDTTSAISTIQTQQVSFLMESSPQDLDLIRKSNSMRWLNDVLKWQVIDLNLQHRNRTDTILLRKQIEAKKDLIKQIIRGRVQRSVTLQQSAVAKDQLAHTVDTLYKISTSSFTNTASSTPPVTSVKMVQSPAAKLDGIEIEEQTSWSESA